MENSFERQPRRAKWKRVESRVENQYDEYVTKFDSTGAGQRMLLVSLNQGRTTFATFAQQSLRHLTKFYARY